jgi:hypothetical protein
MRECAPSKREIDGAEALPRLITSAKRTPATGLPSNQRRTEGVSFSEMVQREGQELNST